MKIETIDMTPDRYKKKSHKQWYYSDTNQELAEAVYSQVNNIVQQHTSQQDETRRYYRLYSNRPLLQSDLARSAPQNRKNLAEASKITLNIIKSCVDTATAKIAKSRPRVQFLTDEGDFILQRKAKQLTSFIDAEFEEISYYDLAQAAFRDACITGTGYIRFYIEDKKIKAERVLPNEVLVDEADAFYGCPKSIHIIKQIPLSTLEAIYPEEAYNLALSATITPSGGSSALKLVTVVESWYLHPTEGIHTISTSNCLLLKEDYHYTKPPLVSIKWTAPVVGYFGQGLAEELVGIQIEINKILRNIQSAQALMSVPRVFVDGQVNIPAQDFAPNPHHLSVIRYSGNDPKFFTAPAMPPEVYNHLERLIAQAYNITGISQLSATGKKPAGLDSGVALREAQDIESERFAIVAQAYEKLAVDAAKAILQVAKNAELEDIVLADGKKLSFKQLDLNEMQYRIKPFPTNLLPTTPAGRLQKVQDLYEAQFITKEQALSLLEFPDIKSMTSLNNAPIDNARACVERIIETDEYDTPSKYQDISLLLQVATDSYLKGLNSNMPPLTQELLRRFIGECESLLVEKQQQPEEASQLPEQTQPLPETPV